MGRGAVAARLALIERLMAGADQQVACIPPGAPGYDPRANPNKGADNKKRPPKAPAPAVAVPLDYLDEWLALDDGSASSTPRLRTRPTSLSALHSHTRRLPPNLAGEARVGSEACCTAGGHSNARFADT